MYPQILCFLLLSMLLVAVHGSSEGGAASASPPSVYPVVEYTFDCVLDHFNFRPTLVPSFPLRYLINQDHWQRTGSVKNQTAAGPVLFYTGNEADIMVFVNNSGFLFELAAELGAMVVFAEHRYYGTSLPKVDDISYLTVEQALADFNLLQVEIRHKWKMPESTAFVAFGGSYGGNLALWARLKNPNLWAGAIASSATPLKHVLRETNNFTRIETDVYANVSVHCPDLVRKGWKELFEKARTKAGRQTVATRLGLCRPLVDEYAAEDIHGWIGNALETMVQYGYPYPTDFYNPVPAYPFQVTCERMLQAGTGLGALRAAADVYYNFTGQAGQCFGFDDIQMEAGRFWQRKGLRDKLARQEDRIKARYEEKPPERLLQEIETDAWGYQCCTEVYQPMPTDGISDFEMPYTPNRTEYFANCKRHWNVEPRPNWEEMQFMGADISSGSNIFLASGQLDPWRAAGIQTVPRGSPSSIIVRIIEGGAHHYDLRASNDFDTPSVVAVRKEEKYAILMWVKEWKERKSPDSAASEALA